MSDRLRQLEQSLQDLSRIVPVTERILTELLRSSPPPSRLETIESVFRSAHQLEQHGEVAVIEQLLEQTEAGVQSLQQWLAVADLAISPYILRTYVERNPLEPAEQKAWIRYFLEKMPHAESDRDKLDYLLTSYFALIRDTGVVPRFETQTELREAIAELFTRPLSAELEPPVQVMLHELESLIACINDFQDFNQLVGARMVERARALKINLGESFYHPQVLTIIVRFNLAFRRHFEQLFQRQIEQVKAETRTSMEEVRQIFRDIEAAFRALPEPTGTRVTAGDIAGGEEARPEQLVGRSLQVAHERPPIEHLVRRPRDPQKETELRGIIKRIRRHLSTVGPEQAAAGRIVFPLRHTTVELYEWEREAFALAAEGQAPTSARTIRFALGLIAWMEEEYVLYQENRGERYQWKPHFDLLSYAVERTRDQLHTIHGMLQAGGLGEEAAWFPALVNSAQRLVRVLEKIAPAFA
ncbi:MAG: hypothetical protein ACE5MH_00015 [Terriglobia bacterium]